ncbi:MAG: hypothetical protein OGM09_15105 [Fusobacterium varium]|jgi:membrane-associated HD superfamily phosphohydrolase|uniref:hypothetical protein n=1 Tax=Fusobacterium varium TaxID=856 RepID=UPI000E539D30|nr:hypothetical protein [Fusobacterium varium]RHG38839.1 hypothetical protein DW261_01260 [Fusobacterium varium]UYI78469.1 MAG: hypothetical protein OGM09_15105 [Fusobacterium varium]
MKRIVITIFLLANLATVIYSQEITEKEGMRVLKQIRKEVQLEEKEKARAAREAEKIKAAEEKVKISAEKAEEKKGKKILEEIRRDMNESLEEKVFRSENNPEARMVAAEKAFEIGRERMAFLKAEEKEIMELEKSLGIEDVNRDVFLGQKFDKVYDEFKANNNELEILLLENEKLKEYLSRLDRMEEKVKAGN